MTWRRKEPGHQHNQYIDYVEPDQIGFRTVRTKW